MTVTVPEPSMTVTVYESASSGSAPDREVGKGIYVSSNGVLGSNGDKDLELFVEDWKTPAPAPVVSAVVIKRLDNALRENEVLKQRLQDVDADIKYYLYVLAAVVHAAGGMLVLDGTEMQIAAKRKVNVKIDQDPFILKVWTEDE